MALVKAQEAASLGEVPVAAAIVESHSGRLLALEMNRMRARNDPTQHAEMLAIQTACAALCSAYLVGCDLYVTLEPCAMCAQAMAWARISRLYFGAYDPKSGGVEHGARVFDHATCHHRPEIYGGIGARESEQLLKDFFAATRG